MNKRTLIGVYLAGYLVCLASCGLFHLIEASRASILALIVFGFQNSLEQHGMRFELIAAMIGSLAPALLFVLVAVLVVQKNLGSRIAGWTLMVILALVTLYWGHLSSGLLDPAPQEQGKRILMSPQLASLRGKAAEVFPELRQWLADGFEPL